MDFRHFCPGSFQRMEAQQIAQTINFRPQRTYSPLVLFDYLSELFDDSAGTTHNPKITNRWRRSLWGKDPINQSLPL